MGFHREAMVKELKSSWIPIDTHDSEDLRGRKKLPSGVCVRVGGGGGGGVTASPARASWGFRGLSKETKAVWSQEGEYTGSY